MLPHRISDLCACPDGWASSCRYPTWWWQRSMGQKVSSLWYSWGEMPWSYTWLACDCLEIPRVKHWLNLWSYSQFCNFFTIEWVHLVWALCGNLDKWIKHSVSFSHRCWQLEAGKEKLYPEQISTPLKMNYCSFWGWLPYFNNTLFLVST